MMHQSIIWPAWLAGSGIGLLMVAFFWITGKQLGVSRAYGNFISLMSKNPFFQQQDYINNAWRIWFILGVVIGGFIAAMIAHPGELVLNFDMGDAYNAILPMDLTLRMIVLFFGGVVMGVGARLAGGCTSGHVISGIPMMNGSSVLSGVLFVDTDRKVTQL